MNYELTHETYGAQVSRNEITQVEAINRLIDCGVLPERADTLLDVLPCGVGVVFRDRSGDKYTILRLR